MTLIQKGNTSSALGASTSLRVFEQFLVLFYILQVRNKKQFAVWVSIRHRALPVREEAISWRQHAGRCIWPTEHNASAHQTGTPHGGGDSAAELSLLLGQTCSRVARAAAAATLMLRRAAFDQAAVVFLRHVRLIMLGQMRFLTETFTA